MNSGAIPDSAITASSSYEKKSVGPLNSRLVCVVGSLIENCFSIRRQREFYMCFPLKAAFYWVGLPLRCPALHSPLFPLMPSLPSSVFPPFSPPPPFHSAFSSHSNSPFISSPLFLSISGISLYITLGGTDIRKISDLFCKGG